MAHLLLRRTNLLLQHTKPRVHYFAPQRLARLPDVTVMDVAETRVANVLKAFGNVDAQEFYDRTATPDAL